MFYTYIIYSKNIDAFYVGSTENIEERIKKHNNKNKGFTNRSNDWQLMFFQEFQTKNESLIFEKKIKNWKSRKMIEKLIYTFGLERPDLKYRTCFQYGPNEFVHFQTMSALYKVVIELFFTYEWYKNRECRRFVPIKYR